MNNYHTNTIAALATASGQGSIGIIRISGTSAILIVEKILKNKNLSQAATHTVHYNFVIDKTTIIDEVLIMLFKAPRSYTGEDMVEINCHASRYIEEKIISLLIQNGAVLAKPGEFTQRAFLNGKLDLAQAEAVADLIAAANKAAHDIAIKQMRGGVSSELQQLRNQLIDFAALLELELDFGEEDVEFADRKKLNTLLLEVQNKLSRLEASFEYGNAIKNGVAVAIVGKPNAGKSTLLNLILQEDRAIVTDIAGTTRDTIEEIFTHKGIQFRFIDTAGLRETKDKVEKIGIEKAKEKMESAGFILYLFDKNDTTKEELAAAIQTLPKEKKLIVIPTKTDLYSNENWSAWIESISLLYKPLARFYEINKEDKTTIQRLLNGMADAVMKDKNNNNIDLEKDTILTNLRHYEALRQASAALEETNLAFENDLSPDLISFHLREAIKKIGEITGAIEIDRDILGTIFGKFCIGK